MLEALISSRTRIKLLMKLFLNPGNSAHLRGLAEEFEESTNAVRLELNRFEEAGMLLSENKGNKKMYKANDHHPFYRDLNGLLLKYIGVDRIIENVIQRLGNLEFAYMAGDYAQGKDSGVIDLILIGDIDTNYLVNLLNKAESLIERRIRYITYTPAEWSRISAKSGGKDRRLLLWKKPEETVSVK